MRITKVRCLSLTFSSNSLVLFYSVFVCAVAFLIVATFLAFFFLFLFFFFDLLLLLLLGILFSHNARENKYARISPCICCCCCLLFWHCKLYVCYVRTHFIQKLKYTKCAYVEYSYFRSSPSS